MFFKSFFYSDKSAANINILIIFKRVIAGSISKIKNIIKFKFKCLIFKRILSPLIK